MTPRDLLTAYDTRFRAKFNGHPAPIVAGKDGKIAATLLARYPPADLERWLTAFFASQDSFICQSTYGLGVFQSVLGKLIAAERVRVETVDADYRAMRRRVEAEQEALEAQREVERARFRKGVA